jgi:hypothetical protein
MSPSLDYGKLGYTHSVACLLVLDLQEVRGLDVGFVSEKIIRQKPPNHQNEITFSG